MAHCWRPPVVLAPLCWPARLSLLLRISASVAALYAVLRLYCGDGAAGGAAARARGVAPSARRWPCSPPSWSSNLSNAGGWAPRRWDRSPPGRIPVLLVHGYLCNRGLWWWLRRRLRARRFAVATVNLEPPLAGLDRLAAQLGERIDALLAETGAEKVVLVTHSMGGLASRAYLRRHGAAHVAGLVTLAAPHHGTQIARLGFGRNAREMEPDSEWLRRLNAEPAADPDREPSGASTTRSSTPPDTSRLADARETILKGLGHMAMVFSPTVLACVEAELTRR